MRISWFSNAPFSNSGYGTQTRVILPRLQALGHEMQCTAFFGLDGARITWQGIPVYPSGFESYSQDVMVPWAEHWKADVIIPFCDAIVLDPKRLGSIPVCPYFPIDGDPLAMGIKWRVSQTFKPIVMSKFGEKVARDAGLDPLYVPHGVDTNIFKPMDQTEARESFKLPQDAYLVGMIAFNRGNRKGFAENFAAFAKFKKNHPDAILIAHTWPHQAGTGGIELLPLLEAVGLKSGTDVKFAPAWEYLLGFNDDQMARLHNAFDVLLACSYGEGFGIPILEAQACGKPVVTGDWSAMSEITFAGELVEKCDSTPTWTGMMTYNRIPHPDAIAACLEEVWRAGPDLYRAHARSGALAYDADLVATHYWQPALAAIQERIDATKPREAVAV